MLNLAGCAFLVKTHVDDLTLSSVSLVRADNAPHDERGWPPQGERKVLLVSLLTRHDIGRTAAENELNNLAADISFCGTSSKLAVSRLFRDGRELGPFLDPEERRLLASAAPGTPPYSYQVWFDYRTLHDPAGGGFIGYDLSKNPKDLCVDIKGTPYMNVGTGLVTNTIIIPKQVISAALAKY